MVLGAVYATFSALLHLSEVPARAVLLPVSPTRYYALQAAFVAPLLAALASVYAAVAWRLCRRTPVDPSLREVWELLVPRYALWLLAGFVVPDLVVFLWAGHGALAPAMKYYGAVAPIAIVASSVVALRRATGASLPRALAASVVALCAQALVGAPLLR